jgi:SAM-dependent methyltransferase
MQDEQKSKWARYYRDTAGKLQSPLLQKALGFVLDRDAALDLGAGALRDTKFLLENGFKKIVAVDADASFLDKVTALHDPRVEGHVSTFDAFTYEVSAYDLVNAQWALPFSPPHTFTETFLKIKTSLKLGGIFVGQFFGLNDEWNVEENKKRMIFLSGEQVHDLLDDVEVITLSESEKDGLTASGKAKHWHVYYVIARK